MHFPGYVKRFAAALVVAVLTSITGISAMHAARANEGGVIQIGASEPSANEAAVFERLAAGILKNVRAPAKVAVSPFAKGPAGLPPRIASHFDRQMLAALQRRAKPGVALVLREGLVVAWDEAVEFHGRTIEELLAEARADVLVSGDAVAGASGLEISYRAISLARGMVGTVLAAPRPEVIHLADEDLQALRFQQSLWRPADALALAALRAMKPDLEVRVIDVVAAGGGGAFAEHLQGLLVGRLRDRLNRRSVQAEMPIGAAPVDPAVLHLALEIWDHEDAVSITMSVRGAGVAASREARLETALIPSHFLPLTRDGGKLGGGMIQARGAAWDSRDLPGRQAWAAARSLARARVTASALGLSMPASGVVRTPVEMVALRRMMERGIPYDEVWTSEAASVDGDVAVALRALVRRVGSASAARVSVAFPGAEMISGEALNLAISAKRRTAHVAVFAWYADDGVTRLYPVGTATAMRIERGGTLVLPPAQGPEYGVTPMPGQRVSMESLIVLSSAAPFDVAALAATPLDDPLASLHRARTASAFFDAMARQDLSVMSIRILNYRVRDE